MRPILLNSSAKAATAAEAAYRIDAPVRLQREARVVALDEGAAGVMSGLLSDPWAASAHFLTYEGGRSPRTGDDLADVVLRRADGGDARLSDELEAADVVVMVASTDAGMDVARAIGHGCTLRGIMTAGLIVDGGAGVHEAVLALRPHARVLIVTKDHEDLLELLTALRV